MEWTITLSTACPSIPLSLFAPGPHFPPQTFAQKTWRVDTPCSIPKQYKNILGSILYIVRGFCQIIYFTNIIILNKLNKKVQHNYQKHFSLDFFLKNISYIHSKYTLIGPTQDQNKPFTVH